MTLQADVDEFLQRFADWEGGDTSKVFSAEELTNLSNQFITDPEGVRVDGATSMALYSGNRRYGDSILNYAILIRSNLGDTIIFPLGKVS